MEQTPPPEPRKTWLSRTLSWVQGEAVSRRAALAVAVWSFLNPILVPFPAESLLIPIALANRTRAIFLTLLASVMATLGAVVAYFFSAFLYTTLIEPLVTQFDVEAQLSALSSLDPFAVFITVFIAALTLIPDSPFIAAAGLLRVDFFTFTLAFFLGRTLRFILVIGGALLVGPHVWRRLETLEERWATMGVILLLAALAVYFLVLH